MPTKSQRTFCLWGWRRGDYAYDFVTGLRAYVEKLEVIGWARFDRDIVTIARRVD